MEEPYFQYGSREMDYLSRKDKKMAAVIARLGPLQRRVMPDVFASLLRSITGQQVSTAAQRTIWGRVRALLGEVTPERLLALSPEALRTAGLSARKVEYMRGIARQVLDGELDLEALDGMEDAAVCRRLSALRGIGVWTAEMLLLFSLRRPDILSYDDLGIRRGLRMLYRHREIPRERFERYRRRFSPYGSVASLYLWAVAGGALPELDDPAERKKGRRG